jgi:deoxyuridine 5'-triphosphate nucleotidohydrolase
MLERTLAVIKPGACNRRSAGEIFSEIENAMGYKVIRAKYFHMDLDTAHEFYKEHAGRPYYDGLIAHTTSGPCMAIELEGENVIKRWRDWIGPTKDATWGALRYKYGSSTSTADNALHGSDSVESAAREIKLVFDSNKALVEKLTNELKRVLGDIGKQHILDFSHLLPPPCPPSCGFPRKERPFILGRQPDLGYFETELTGGREIPKLPTFAEIMDGWRRPVEAPTPSIQFKRIEDVKGLAAKLPIRAKEGDSGLDLYAAEDRLIRTGQAVKVSTGWKIELPAKFEAQIRPRSGMSSKGIMACFGTIDAGYRGELLATLFNITGEDYWVRAGDKIAQLVPMPVYDLPSCEVVGPLSESERGESGFGSTGR